MTGRIATGKDLRGVSMRGWRAAGLLAVLTAVEYVIAVSVDSPLIWLLPFVVAKGWLILDVFMHLRAVLGGEEH